MTDNEKEKRQNAVNFAEAVSGINGSPVSEEAKQLAAQWVNGEITLEQVTEELIRKHQA